MKRYLQRPEGEPAAEGEGRVGEEGGGDDGPVEQLGRVDVRDNVAAGEVVVDHGAVHPAWGQWRIF